MASPLSTNPTFNSPVKVSCPPMSLPTELPRVISATRLVEMDMVLSPHCYDNKDECKLRHLVRDQSKIQARSAHNNPASDIMRLTGETSQEIAELLYEERTFVIHGHEGFRHGGIEFLNSSHLQHQYMDDVDHDGRVPKFEPGHEFGFRGPRKIKMTSFPAGLDEPREARHVQLVTSLIMNALDGLLYRQPTSGEVKRTTRSGS
jgi:hypothetical protein